MLAANNKPTSTVDLKLTGLPVLAAELSNEMGAALLQTALALTPYNATQRNAMRCDAMQGVRPCVCFALLRVVRA